MRRLIHLAVGLLLLCAPAKADEPVLRIAALKFGTVNWLLDTIRTHGLDTAQDYRLDVLRLAGTPATKIAFQSGDADMLVTDWVWALRQRESGPDLRFAPYSSSLGALMGPAGMSDLCALRGRNVGVVGGKLDKSWLVFQALARLECGFELTEETEALFGAPPLMARQLEQGSVDAVSTYWHWAAKLEAGGARRILDVSDALERLGIAPPPAMIGFVWDAGRMDAGQAAAFLRSVAAARERLRHSDAEWERLRPLMKPGSDAEFTALRDRFRLGIPGDWTPVQSAAARKLHALLIENAGTSFASQAGPFDEALFDVPTDDD